MPDPTIKYKEYHEMLVEAISKNRSITYLGFDHHRRLFKEDILLLLKNKQPGAVITLKYMTLDDYMYIQ